ncbi:hypothetical protein B0H34DRAFT_695291 [Crassisporium funariophilum]|nr:hypothetical protein B0H34DRAFT_695291 [Crassisporium funariophilum]
MSNSPVTEIFIPPSPSTFIPKNLPPRLPTPENISPLPPPHYAYNLTQFPRSPCPFHTPVSPWWSHFNPWNLPPPPPVICLHPQLAYNSFDISSPQIIWDIINPPDYAGVRSDPHLHKRWTVPDFDGEAFKPSVKKIWVLSDHPVLAYWIDRWGPITIESAKITIREVLQGIYNYLRVPLTRRDLGQIKSIPGNRDALRSTRAHRARDSYEVESVVLGFGYRRVDVIGGHRRWQGVRIVVLEDNTWRLFLGLLPGPVAKVP